ncbi:Retinal-specific ATP-binding cassette transporter [Schistosoma japonicum]|uniref:Retinal-specific ATP-binding cassette transporter n=1 Tax=Schistosoma japonicum TaxID=6182 RepID=A0A4Z2CW86_SCHJA|nr:Retinal-specific ATP-binding cassette transporter [Schistosoma japonicum]
MCSLQISNQGIKNFVHQSWKHYRVLLWKDYLLRRRSFWLIIAELFFVLIFVIAIAIIRRRHAVDPKPSCFLQSQSMLSMGLLTYMQSLVCNFNYTCNENHPQSIITLNGFAPVIYFLNNITHLVDDPVFTKWFSESAKFEAEHFTDWIQLGLKLTHLQTSVNNMRIWINENILVFKNSSGIKSLEYVSQLVCGTPANQNDLGRLFIALNQPTDSDDDADDDKDTSKASNNLPIINHLMSQFSEHVDISMVAKALTEKPMPHINLCPILIHLLNSNSLMVTFGRLRYFLFGTLAYYPSNQFTDEIIYHMGSYTRLLSSLRQLTNAYFSELRPLLSNVFNNKSYSTKIYDQLKRCKDDKHGILPSEFQEACHFFYNIIQQNTVEHNFFNLSWKLFLRISDLFIAILHELLADCFQIDQKYISFTKRSDFDSYMKMHQNNQLTSPIGLVFDQIPANFNNTNNDNNNINDKNVHTILERITNSPNIFSVSLRKNPLFIDKTSSYQVLDRYSVPVPRRDPQKEMKYFTSGFIDVQEQLSRALIYVTSKKLNAIDTFSQLFNDTGIEMKMFPTAPYDFDALLVNIIFLLPQLMVLGWVLSVILTVKYMVDEKENRLVDFLRTFGISVSMNWLAWITISFVLMALFSLPIVAILKYGKIIPLTDMTLSYFVIINYTVSCLFYCILFTSLSLRSTIASIVAGITYFLLFMPAAVLLRYNELPRDLLLIPFCLIPQVSHSLSWIFLDRLELQGTGAQWTNIWHTGNSHSILSLGSSMIFLWIGTILLGVLAFWGIPSMRRCCMLFMHKFESQSVLTHSTSINGLKKRKKRKLSSANLFDTSNNTSQLSVNLFQTDRQSLLNSSMMTPVNTASSQSVMITSSVIVDNLCKTYQPSNRVALCNVNMQFYEDQITVILGRNGAGKTTLLSILVGILQPTKGKIIMHGQVTNQRFDVLRRMLGYCPQYDILYDTLTVAEHINLFGSLKGISSSSLNQKLDDYLHKLGLTDKRNEQACRLSGGQRRKLSLFLAFLGNSSVIVLDEPTSSLDPFSRRAVWDLLKTLRKGRTIILSSHHMYESELLADQISIISEGKVLCSGSSLSLKSAYGSGYHLSLEIDQSIVNTYPEHNEMFSALLKAIQNHVTGARLLRHDSNKLTIYLPTCDALTGQFTNLFQQLDNQEFQNTHHIKHFEIADSSLEEVFLSITDDIQSPTKDSSDYEYVRGFENGFINNTEFDHKSNLSCMDQSGCMINHCHKKYYHNRNESKIRPSYINMIKAMFYKRYIYLKRNKFAWIIEFIFPCLLILTGIGFLEYFQPNDLQPPMDINHWLMKSSHVDEMIHFYSHNTNVHLNEKHAFQSYLNVLNNPLSLTGVGCIPSKLHSFQPSISSKCLIQNNGQVNLDKTYYSKVCEAYSTITNKFPCYSLATGDILLNLSSINVSTYLLNHSRSLRNYMFGGIEFRNVEKSELNEMFYSLFSMIGNYSPTLKQSNNWRQFLTDLHLMLPPSKMIRLWYDNHGYVSAVAYLNLLQNLQYRMLLSSAINELSKQNKIAVYGDDVAYPTNSGIIITNHPLPYPESPENSKMNLDIKSDYLLSLFLILALSFVPASFINLPVYERNNNSKHLQNISGLIPLIYWTVNYIYDCFIYFFASSLCILIIVIHGNSAYVQPDAIYPFILTIYFYGLAMVSFIYLASFLFKSASTAFVLMCGLNLVIGAVTIFVRFFLEVLSIESVKYKTTSQVVSYWLRISPHYCLSGSFYAIVLRDFFKKIGLSLNKNNSVWKLLQIDMGCLFLQSILLFTLVLLLEKRFYIAQILHWRRKKFKWNRLVNSHVGIHYTDLESNIQKNTEDLSSKSLNDAIIAQSVVKHYWSQKKPTVEQLNLTVQAGECYGLLGVNGAGKSTTYSMLTGYCTATSGHIFLNGYDITLEKEKACQSIGYCPQQDALFEFMTPREILTFYSYLRFNNNNVNVKNRNNGNFNHVYQVNRFIQLTGLQQYADRLITTLSGGNKRKLSTAIALFGNPSIIFLDEPSTGMDPQAKYLLWKNIQNALKLNCTILLSSHCMEECEMLCNRIGLLIKGKIRCTGSPLELKQRYGLGYHVDIEFTSNILQFTNCINDLQVLLNEYLPDFKLRYPLLTRQEYHYNKTQPLWKLFNALEHLHKHQLIQNISIRQSTLEDVFVNFISMYEQNNLLD